MTTIKFITTKTDINLIQVPRTRREVLKIQFKSLDAQKKDSHMDSPRFQKGEDLVLAKSRIPSLSDAAKFKHLGLPQRLLRSKSDRTGIVEGITPKPEILVSSGRQPLKSRKPIVSKLPKRTTFLLNKRVSSLMDTETLIQKARIAPQSHALLTSKSRLIKRKANMVPSLERKVWWNAETHRLSHARTLQLFQALLREPLSFLELHSRFAVSKRTVVRFVKNGLLNEVWGPRAVGVRFKLSKKGKTYLKELEEAAKYEPKMMEKAFIRLKQRISL